MRRILSVIVFSFSVFLSNAQTGRITTHQAIGWYNYFGTFKLNKKWSIHTEYQWRRNDIIKSWQQSLLRVGINYRLNPRVLFRAGYAWAETFPYGEIPINAAGKDFTEHRIYEMVQLAHKEGRLDLTHRFMLEQRFVGRYSQPALTKEDEYPFLNRMRYMFRAQLPLKGNTIADKTPYVAAYDEIFIGFGENVVHNIFDQNRIGLLAGYNINKTVRIEAGYLHQTVQLGREIGGRNILQKNNGLIVNLNFSF